MDREVFVERVMRGEEVNLDDVGKLQAEQELESIRAEAAQRIDAERRRQAAAELRESQIAEMVTLAAEAGRVLAEDAENERRKLEVLRSFAEKEIEIRGRYNQTFAKFTQIFQQLGDGAYQNPFAPSPVSDELKERGADLRNLELELTRRPLSPMAQQIADERYRRKS